MLTLHWSQLENWFWTRITSLSILTLNKWQWTLLTLFQVLNHPMTSSCKEDSCSIKTHNYIDWELTLIKFQSTVPYIETISNKMATWMWSTINAKSITIMKMERVMDLQPAQPSSKVHRSLKEWQVDTNTSIMLTILHKSELYTRTSWAKPKENT